MGELKKAMKIFDRMMEVGFNQLDPDVRKKMLTGILCKLYEAHNIFQDLVDGHLDVFIATYNVEGFGNEKGIWEVKQGFHKILGKGNLTEECQA